MKKKVTICVDMQNDFITGSLANVEGQKIVQSVVNKVKEAKANKEFVVFTKDTHYENYLKTFEGKNLPVEHCIMNTSGWDIIPELKELSEDCYIINKLTFGYEDWKTHFLAEEYELFGVCTDICVISNALALRMFFPEVKITVDASCCAGVTPAKHKAALEVMKSCQINVINE